MRLPLREAGVVLKVPRTTSAAWSPLVPLGFRVMWGLYRGYIGIMEQKMEATIQGLEFRFRG